jgi:hypothetical protein
MTQPKMTIINEGTDWEMLKMEGKWATWTIDKMDKDGDVEIMCEDPSGAFSSSNSLFLTQDELKLVIAFLQKQVK